MGGTTSVQARGIHAGLGRPDYEVRRHRLPSGEYVSILTIRVHVSPTAGISPNDLRRLQANTEHATDAAFNSAPSLLSGDRVLVDVVFTDDPTNAHLDINATPIGEGRDNWSPGDTPTTLADNLRMHLGLMPAPTNGDPSFTPDDLRQLSNDIAAANTDTRFDNPSDTRIEGPKRLEAVEDPAYQHFVEDSLRNGNEFQVGADPRTHPYGQLINDGGPTFPGRSNNCLDCSLSALSSFFGNPQISAPRYGDVLPDGTIDTSSGERKGSQRAAQWLNQPWEYHSDTDTPIADQFIDLHNRVAALGPGSAALVINEWHARDADGKLRYDENNKPITVSSHATVIVYPPGASGPVWWDPQSGQTSDTPPAWMVDESCGLWSIPIAPDQGGNNAAPATNPSTSAGLPDGVPRLEPAVHDLRDGARLGLPTDSDSGGTSERRGTGPGELRGQQTDRNSDGAPQPASDSDREGVRRSDSDRTAGPGLPGVSTDVESPHRANSGDPGRDRLPSPSGVSDPAAPTAGRPSADDQQTQSPLPHGHSGNPSDVPSSGRMGPSPQPDGSLAGDRDVRVLNSPSANDPTTTPATSPTAQSPFSGDAQSTSRTAQSSPSTAPTPATGDPSNSADNRPTTPGDQKRPDNRIPAPGRPDDRASVRPEHRTPTPDQPTRPEERTPTPNQPTRPEPRQPFSDHPTRPEPRPAQPDPGYHTKNPAPQDKTQNPNRRSFEEWQSRFQQHEYNPNSNPWATTPAGFPTDPTPTPPQSQTPPTTPVPTQPAQTNPTDHQTTPLTNTPSNPQSPTNTTTPDNPTPPDSTTPPVTHTPTSTALGDDPATRRVQNNLRNEGDFDVIFHADQNGTPLNNLTPDQIVDAIRSNPNYKPGTPIRLIACNTANNPALARHIANELGAPVHTPSDAVGTPNKPNSPAHIRNNGTWTTHHPTTPEGHTPTPTTHTPTTPSTPPAPDEPVDYMGDDTEPAATDGGSTDDAHSRDRPQDASQREIMQQQVKRANEDERYFREYYRSDGQRKDKTRRDDTGHVPPQLVRDTRTGEWIAASDAPPPIPPKYHDIGELGNPTGRDSATAEALERLDAAAQRRHQAIQSDIAAEKLLKSAKDAAEKDDTQANRDELERARAAHKPLHHEMARASEDFGESIAEHHVIPDHYPGAERQPLGGPANGNDQFDQVWKTPDGRFVVVEAKSSVDTELGARNLPNGIRASQGTREYFNDIIRLMEERGENELAEDLMNALDAGELDYILVKGNKNTGEYAGYTMAKFDITTEGHQ
ncbi:toxin glutamine deamidase domain-containing protein [Nocardia amikacinitolerans]|uniref:toxin glutamine deamidase domain-containing protein n=1 Tax=Nocardia amikacinitolerans TaxID=756689 RepID=UPI0027E302D3|nr:toxin glutamine deamidase domain-containing protein [Nocardia amikacinitolerans]